MLKFFINYLLQ